MNKFQIRIVTRALDAPEELTEWEHEFIDSISERGDDYELSENQNRVLNRIGQKLDFG